jgi:hypothetical protein
LVKRVLFEIEKWDPPREIVTRGLGTASDEVITRMANPALTVVHVD